MTEYFFHTVSTGERWDNIAYKYYKNSYDIKPIIEANSYIPVDTELEEGTTIKIPVIKTGNSDKTLLPKWKRKTIE